MYFLSILEHCWCDIFMNYVNSLSLNIFINITYKYILIFIDCFIKMKHLVFITSMKVEEVINCFYAYIWKHHDLLKFFMSDQDTQFIFNVWKYMCKMLKINAKLLMIYHFEIDDQIEKIRLIVKSSFELTFWTRTEIESSCSHFQPDSSRIAHIFNSTRLDSTENWVNSIRFAKNSSLTSRGLNIEVFPVFDFCITFLHYLFDRSHDGKHEDYMIESHEEESW